jgi:hypothetical protein
MRSTTTVFLGWVEDFARAQELFQSQLSVDWPKMLNPIAQALNPIHEEIFSRYRVNYYWAIPSSEYATDVVFERQQDLQRLYPLMVRHGILNLSSPDVLRWGERSPQAVRFPTSTARSCSAI